MQVTIIHDGIESRTDAVRPEDVTTRLAAKGRYAAEAALLLAWMQADFEAPNWPATLTDLDGTEWSLESSRSHPESSTDWIVYRCK